MEDILTKESSLTYDGYTIVKLHKKISVEGNLTDVSYAVLKKGDKVIADFDGLDHPMGNDTKFGLFPFLGGASNQLIVEQSIPRNWSHWIVNVVPDYHVIFDSSKWGVDGELTLIDVNHDGIYEFSKVLTTFYDFDKLPTAQSPLIDILFTYDNSAKEYVPASQIFQEFALNGIDDEVKSLDRGDERAYLSTVVHIVLRYIYAGKREEGWAFYDREFNLANKSLIKSSIVNKLSNEPVYKFIYGR